VHFFDFRKKIGICKTKTQSAHDFSNFGGKNFVIDIISFQPIKKNRGRGETLTQQSTFEGKRRRGESD
jgi:hypothetical protein